MCAGGEDHAEQMNPRGDDPSHSVGGWETKCHLDVSFKKCCLKANLRDMIFIPK